MSVKNFYYSNKLESGVTPYEFSFKSVRKSASQSSDSSNMQDEFFSFLDFLDSSLSDDNIVVADEDQLNRIESLVDGVDFE